MNRPTQNTNANHSSPPIPRLGLRLFAVYSFFYAGFVLVNAFAAPLNEWIPFGGLNLAIWWGFALIVGAFVLSLIYGFLAKDEDVLSESDTPAQEEQGKS